MWHIASPKLWIFFSLIGPLLGTLGTMSPKLKTLHELRKTHLNAFYIVVFTKLYFFQECWHIKFFLPHGAQSIIVWCLIKVINRYNFGLVEWEAKLRHEFTHSHLHVCECILVEGVCFSPFGYSLHGNPKFSWPQSEQIVDTHPTECPNFCGPRVSVLWILTLWNFYIFVAPKWVYHG